jgi:hypothetical protein
MEKHPILLSFRYVPEASGNVSIFKMEGAWQIDICFNWIF